MAKAAKALTKSQITAVLAEKAEITKKQALTVLETLAELAYKNAKNTFTSPVSASWFWSTARLASAAIRRPVPRSRSRPRRS
jgi:hypothetical protein